MGDIADKPASRLNSHPNLMDVLYLYEYKQHDGECYKSANEWVMKQSGAALPRRVVAPQT